MSHIKLLYHYTRLVWWTTCAGIILLVTSLYFRSFSFSIYAACCMGVLHIADAMLKLSAKNNLATWMLRKTFLLSVCLAFIGGIVGISLFPTTHVTECILLCGGIVWSAMNLIILLRDKRELRDLIDQKELIYF